MWLPWLSFIQYVTSVWPSLRLANKNVGRQSMLLKGVLLNELLEGELDVVLSFLADTNNTQMLALSTWLEGFF